MQKPIRWLITLGWFSAVLLAPISARANETQSEETSGVPMVYISEIAWAGSSLSNADEWIELANLGTETINLSNWILIGAGSSGSDISLPEGATIEPNSTYLISNYDSEHEKSVLAVPPNFVTTSLSLSNSALGITLTNELGTVVDSAGDGGTPAAGNSGEFKTMTRVSIEDGTLTNSWVNATESLGFDPETTELGTPGTSILGEQPFVPTDDNSNNDNTYDPDSTDPAEAGEESQPEDGDEPSGTDPADSSEAEVPDEQQLAPTSYPVGTLIINEFVCDPSEGEEEWVEIWNPYNNVVPLEGWTIADGSGAKTYLPDQLLGMHQFVLVLSPKGKLNNDGDTITLFDPTGGVINEIVYGTETIPAATDPNSVARAEDGTWSATETPTPGWVNEISVTIETESEAEAKAETVSTEPINQATAPEPTEETVTETKETILVSNYDLRLVGIYPNTSEGDAEHESITIKNIGSEIIELTGWQLTDASKHYDLPTVSIEPEEILTFFRKDTDLALNNSGGETVSIIASNGVITDVLTYEKTKKGFELVLGPSGWSWQNHALGNESTVVEENETPTDLPTEPINIALAPNPVVEKQSEDVKLDETTFESNLTEVRTMARGTQVRVTGTVSVEPGVFGKQVMYLAGSGIQIYFYRADWPTLVRGDTVTLTGEVVESYNETRIKISSVEDISVIGHTEEPVPHEISLEGVNEDTEGWLVTASGTIQSIDNDRLILEDNNSTLKVIAKEGTGIDLGEFVAGDAIQITGIVSQYYEEYRLLPRSIEDIVLQQPELTGLAGLTAKEQAMGRRRLFATILGTLVGLTLLALLIRYRSRFTAPDTQTQKLNYNVIN